jgi:hypothetical protein
MNKVLENKLAPGNKVIIRTVTTYWIGEVVEIDGEWVELKDASWVMDTGKWAECVKTGSIDTHQREDAPWKIVNLSAAVDISPWMHDLPK